MEIRIDETRIGEMVDLPATVVCVQIGVTRIGSGGRVQPRNARGRFVSVRSLVSVDLDIDTLTDLVSAPLPPKKMMTAVVRKVAIALALVVTRVIRPALTRTARALRALLNAAEDVARVVYNCAIASWRAGTVVFPSMITATEQVWERKRGWVYAERGWRLVRPTTFCLDGI